MGRVDLDPQVGQLAGRTLRLELLESSGERGSGGPGDAYDVAHLLLVASIAGLDRDRPEHLGAGRQVEGRQCGLEVVRLAGDRRDP